MENVYEMAVRGLDVVRKAGMVRVRDGEDTWLCRARAWRAAEIALASRTADDSDESGSEAYGLLCGKVRNIGPIASINGTSKGQYETLVREAYEAELIDADDVRPSAAGRLLSPRPRRYRRLR